MDKVQAEYVADIRLRNINKEYILKRTAETEQLEKDIADLADLIAKPTRIQKEIIRQLEAVKKAHGQDRRTEILLQDQLAEEVPEEEDVPSYPVHLFLSREGYFKKITPQSLRMSGEQKYKEGDGPAFHWETTSAAELLFFTNRQQCYKAFAHAFDDSKASVLGDYLPAKLEMEEGETILWAGLAGDYTGQLLFFFANGKVARVPLASYQTVTRRKKLTGAYSDKSPLKDVLALPAGQEEDVVLYSTEGRALLFQTDGHSGENHPVHPGGPGDDPEEILPGGPRRPAGTDQLGEPVPLPGPQSACRRGAAEGGGSGGPADDVGDLRGAFSSPSSPLERAGTEPSRAGPYFFEEIGERTPRGRRFLPLGTPFSGGRTGGRWFRQVGAWPAASKTNASWPAHQLGRAGEVVY